MILFLLALASPGPAPTAPKSPSRVGATSAMGGTMAMMGMGSPIAETPDCSARPEGPVGEWAQCGGVGCDGLAYEATCAEDLVCAKSSKWWAACLTEKNAAGVVEQVEGAFAQCAGNTDEEAGLVYEGSTTCPEGYECVEVSSWYSNCKPAAE